MEAFEQLWPISDVPSKYISIYDGPDVFLEDYARVSIEHRLIFAAYWFQGEFLNGGLGQFFENSTGVLAPEAVDACEALGMPRLASKLQEAMSWFGNPYPRMRGVRQKMLKAAARSGQDPFERLDEEVGRLIYEEGSGLEAAALAFIRRDVEGADAP